MKTNWHWKRREFLTRTTTAAAGFSAASIIRPFKSFAQRSQKLVYWHLPMFTPLADQITEEIFNEFVMQAGLKPEEASFITVNNSDLIPKLSASLEAGSPPDAARLYESYVQLYRGQGHLMDVTAEVDGMKQEDGGLFESSLAAIEFDGKYWGMPFAINPWPMHARVDLLEEAGLDYPATWEEFVETCKTIQSPPFYGFGMDLGLTADATDNIMQLCWCFGGQTADASGAAAFNNQGNIDGFNFINMMYNDAKIIPKGVVGNGDTAWNNKAYQSGQVAFINNPTSVYAYLADKDPELMAKTGLFPVPAGPAGSVNQIDTWSIGLFKQSPEPQLVKDFVSYMMQPDNYEKVINNTNHRFVPVYQDLFDTPYWTDRPEFGSFREIAQTGVPVSYKAPPSAGSGEVLGTNVIPEHVQIMLIEGMPAEEAVGLCHEKIAAIYERMNG